MATSQKYGMGQIRYNNDTENPYIRSITNDETKFESINITANGLNMKDQYLEYNSFSKNVTYLLSLKIAKNINYENTFEVLLSNEKPDQFSNNAQTQIIKYFTVVPPKDVEGKKIDVVVYELVYKDPITNAQNKETKVGKCITNPNSTLTINTGEVVRDTTGNTENTANMYYYCKVSSTFDSNNVNTDNFVSIEKKILQTINYNWDNDSTTSEYDNIDIVFTPDADNYKYLWIRLQRTNEDSNIYNSTSGLYGRDFSKDFDGSLKVFENFSDVSLPWTNVGIYGRPNTKMHINGEELRIPQSGYFELNDFDIETFGIAANADNPFTIDYQYKIDMETTTEDDD